MTLLHIHRDAFITIMQAQHKLFDANVRDNCSLNCNSVYYHNFSFELMRCVTVCDGVIQHHGYAGEHWRGKRAAGGARYHGDSTQRPRPARRGGHQDHRR